jgi:adenosine deaminase
LFGASLNDEVGLLADPFGLDVESIDEILLNAVRHSFLPAAEKQRLEADYRTQMDCLKTVHLQPHLQHNLPEYSGKGTWSDGQAACASQ